MIAKPLFGALLAATFMAAPLPAQTDPQSGRPVAEETARGYVGVPSPVEPAVDAQQKPVTQNLNNAIAANSTATNDTAEAQYDADRAAYMNALIKHDAAINRTDARYVRQQTAYANAMAAWRIQVDACKRGRHKACKLPTPNPADYY